MVSVGANELQLDVGDRLQLENVGSMNPYRYQVQVIGFLPGQSLLVSTPSVEGKVLLIREGQRFNVRMIHGAAVQGFTSSVLHSYASPYPHLHLSYPREVESMRVRKAQRATTDIKCNARNTIEPDVEDNYHPIVIADLSHSGARLLSQRILAQLGDGLLRRFALPVCEFEEDVGLMGVVRSQGVRSADANQSNYQTGVEFKALNRFQKVMLHAHVLESLVDMQKSG